MLDTELDDEETPETELDEETLETVSDTEPDDEETPETELDEETLETVSDTELDDEETPETELDDVEETALRLLYIESRDEPPQYSSGFPLQV